MATIHFYAELNTSTLHGADTVGSSTKSFSLSDEAARKMEEVLMYYFYKENPAARTGMRPAIILPSLGEEMAEYDDTPM